MGDFNGDGKPDLATANYGDDTVSVLLNLGDGGFGPATTYAVGSGPYQVIAGDFNGDGQPDLVTANYGPQATIVVTVSALINQGGGTFAPQVTFSVGYDPDALALGDFNGDGRPDLAVANADSSSVSVLLNACSP